MVDLLGQRVSGAGPGRSKRRENRLHRCVVMHMVLITRLILSLSLSLSLSLNLNLNLNPAGQHYLGKEGEVMEMVLIARKDLAMPTGLGFRVLG
jgi:hypothetical protein